MKSPIRNQLGFGQTGLGVYDSQRKEWRFVRSGSRGDLRSIEPAAVVFPGHGEDHVVRSSQDKSKLRPENLSRSLTVSFPDIGAVDEGLLKDEDTPRTFDRDLHDHLYHQSNLLTFGFVRSVNATGKESWIGTYAMATGQARQILRISPVEPLRGNLRDHNSGGSVTTNVNKGNVSVDLPGLGSAESGCWSFEGDRLEQIAFSHQGTVVGKDWTGKDAFLAARTRSKIILFHAEHRKGAAEKSNDEASESLESEIQLNAVFSMTPNASEGLLYVDLAFNPWTHRQIAVLDERGSWSIYNILWGKGMRNVRAATCIRTQYVSSVLQTGMLDSSSLVLDDDGWGKIGWSSEDVIFICRRHQIVTQDLGITDGEQRQVYLRTTETREWLLDAAADYSRENHVFVLTTDGLLWLSLKQYSHPTRQDSYIFQDSTVIQWPHFRDPNDTSLRMVVSCVEKDAGEAQSCRDQTSKVLMYSRNDGSVAVFQPSTAETDKVEVLFPDPSRLDFYDRSPSQSTQADQLLDMAIYPIPGLLDGEGLTGLEGEKWRNQRQLFTVFVLRKNLKLERWLLASDYRVSTETGADKISDKSRFLCEACKFSTNKPASMRRHMKTEKHRRALARGITSRNADPLASIAVEDNDAEVEMSPIRLGSIFIASDGSDRIPHDIYRPPQRASRQGRISNNVQGSGARESPQVILLAALNIAAGDVNDRTDVMKYIERLEDDFELNLQIKAHSRSPFEPIDDILNVGDLEEASAQLQSLITTSRESLSDNASILGLGYPGCSKLCRMPPPTSEDSLTELYESAMSAWVGPLSSAISGQSRVAKEKLVRSIAAESCLSLLSLSGILEKPAEGYADSNVASQQPNSPPPDSLDPFSSQYLSQTQSQSQTQPSSSSSPNDLDLALHRLRQFTTTTATSARTLPPTTHTKISNIISHWTTTSPPSQYNYTQSETRISTADPSTLTQQQRDDLAKQQRRKERRERRMARQTAQFEKAVAQSSQAAELEVSGSSALRGPSQSRAGVAGSASQTPGFGRTNTNTMTTTTAMRPPPRPLPTATPRATISASQPERLLAERLPGGMSSTQDDSADVGGSQDTFADMGASTQRERGKFGGREPSSSSSKGKGKGKEKGKGKPKRKGGF